MKKNLKIMEERKPRRSYTVIAVLLLISILAACGPAATPEPTATAVPPTAVPPTAVPPTEVPAAATPVPDPAYYENEPVAVVPAGEAGKPMVTAAYNTAIFSGPGTNYVVYGAFLGSSTAIAVGISADSQWYAISVPVAPGGNGWVSALYVIPQDTAGLPVLAAPPVPPTTALVPPAAGDPQATALANVYVRTGPGTNYPAYGIAPAGAMARVIGKSEDGLWWVVRLDPTVVGAGYGWVEAAYTQASNTEAVTVIATPEAPPAVVVPAPPAGAPTATAIDYVNLRSGPGTNYLILGVAAPGATGEVSGKSSDGLWWQVKVPVEYVASGAAWVAAEWVTTANTENVPVVEAPAPPPTDVSTTPPPSSQCVLVSQDPADNTTFPPSTGFNTTWVLQNTSATSWAGPSGSLVFLGAMAGTRLHEGGDTYGMSQNVDPGNNYTVTIPMITPPGSGQYGEAWSLQSGGTTLCTFWVIVNVQ
jgi:uncharacterized protein YraI